MELWALLSITAPGLFPSPKAFTDYFRKPIESGTQQGTVGSIAPPDQAGHVAPNQGSGRRGAAPEQEQVLVARPGAKHRKIYDTGWPRERRRCSGCWATGRRTGSRCSVADPAAAAQPRMPEWSTRRAGRRLGEGRLPGRTVPELVAEGHRALVFSQFTGFLDIVRAHLERPVSSSGYLDGSSSSRQRDLPSELQGRREPGVPDQPQGGWLRAQPHRSRLLLRL